MNAKIILFSILLIPFIAVTQTNENSLKLDSSLFSIPSSLTSFQMVKGDKELDSSYFDVLFTPITSKNIRALRSGVVEAQLNYSIAIDTSSMDSTGFTKADYLPVFPKGSEQFKRSASTREMSSVDSKLEEYFLAMKMQQEIKTNPSQTDLNYLFQIGDWSESMYLISKYVLRDRNLKVGLHVIDQENSIDIMTAKLKELNTDNDLTEIIISFEKLQTIYDEIIRVNKVSKPKVDKKNKTTTITSTTKTKRLRRSFIQIENELNVLRNKIHNHTDNQTIQH